MTFWDRPQGNTFWAARQDFGAMQAEPVPRGSPFPPHDSAFGLDGASRPMSNPPFPARTCSSPLEERCLETLLGRPLEVEVRDSVDKALKILKQKMSKEGILQEIKRRRYYEKPSVKRKRKMREARKRRRREAKRRVPR